MTSRNPLLVTGGAGYIGSHVVLAFRDAGYPVVVLDDLSTGRRDAVPDGVAFVEGDAGCQETVSGIIADSRIAAVIHLAGSTSVPESVADPLHYYGNNSATSADLIRACVQGKVTRFIFSSSAAVYGIPEANSVPESAPTNPINPYGSSKLVTEWVLRDTAAAHDFRYIALRYFNVAGADPAGRAGQSSRNAAHLIKVACEAVVGVRGHVTIFGTDYDTDDGTCVRDYIHVTDLAAAHVAALRHLEEGGESCVLNCGYSRGFSVREVLDEVQEGERDACRSSRRSTSSRRSSDAGGRRVTDSREIGMVSALRRPGLDRPHCNLVGETAGEQARTSSGGIDGATYQGCRARNQRRVPDRPRRMGSPSQNRMNNHQLASLIPRPKFSRSSRELRTTTSGTQEL